MNNDREQNQNEDRELETSSGFSGSDRGNGGQSAGGSYNDQDRAEGIDSDRSTDRQGGRGVTDGADFRAGAGGARDESAGMPGGTLGTGGRREQDQ